MSCDWMFNLYQLPMCCEHGEQDVLKPHLD